MQKDTPPDDRALQELHSSGSARSNDDPRHIVFSMGPRNRLLRIAFAILLLSRVIFSNTSTSGPRVAICFFGLTRSLEYTIQNIRSALYDPLIMANIHYDVFVHTYNTTQITNPRSWEDHVAVDWRLHKLLQPSATLVESADEVFNTRFASTFGDLLANGDAWDEDHHSSLRNMLLQLNSLEKVHQLASQEAPYNVIIASRSDLWFFNPLNTSQLQEASMFPSRLYVADFHNWGGLNDRFAFGSIEAMDVYCNRIRGIMEYALTHRVHAEHLLGYVVKNAGLDVHYTSLVFERVRSNGYLQGVPEFDNGQERNIASWGQGQYLRQSGLAMWQMTPERPLHKH